ncbi:uncharacterized protein LOC143018734 [Oratosquilla oratoria]|uniref:uncharacterized protein LOC143018734 n=1 Tax=Oratosquilla oratoria TaxID=337810 RepID=UPI003F75C905
MDPLKPRLPRMWKIVGTLLLCAIFVTKNQACHVFHLGTSDDDQSRGQAVTFVRGEMEVTVKASSQEEGKFGFYLLNQNDTVAGITLEQTNTSVFIEFLSKIKENQEDISEVNENLETISIAFVNTTLFKNDVMRRVRIHYTHGLLAVSFLVKGEEFTEDDLDFRSSKDVYGDSATKEYWITRKARVTPLFGLPLSIYPVVLAGQGHKVSLNCLRGLGNVDPSKYFLERFPKEGSSWMYFIPSRDFKLATLIFDLSEGPTSVGLDAEDVVTDRYNLLKLEYKSEVSVSSVVLNSSLLI